MKTELPTTLISAIRYFSDEKVCVEFLSKLRWDLGKPVCPKCGGSNCVGLKNQKLFQCNDNKCKKQFSIKAGSVFEKSPIPLTKWLPAIWMLVNDKNGISSYELHRGLGVTQKTAWFMLHRIREVLHLPFPVKLSGEVEADETWIGGSGRFMSPYRKVKAGITTMGRRKGDNKTIVLGMVERGGTVVAKVVENTRRKSLLPEIVETIEKGTTVYTDALKSYELLGTMYDHKTIDHRFEFVQGAIHTNTMENFWSLLKRSIKGTYVQIAAFHVDRYVTEQAFRYNNRKTDDLHRFVKATAQIFGRRLTYAELIGVL